MALSALLRTTSLEAEVRVDFFPFHLCFYIYLSHIVISNSTQLLKKIFHAADIFLANHDIDMSQNQFVTEIKVKAPLTLDGMSCLFETNQNNLVFARKSLQPYVDDETRVQLLSKPLPSIYPLSRTVSIYKHNIYRLESKFREFLKIVIVHVINKVLNIDLHVIHFTAVREGAPFDRLAMAIFYINKPFLKYTGTQLQARFLLHSFTAAAAHAQHRYGVRVTFNRALLSNSYKVNI